MGYLRKLFRKLNSNYLSRFFLHQRWHSTKTSKDQMWRCSPCDSFWTPKKQLPSIGNPTDARFQVSQRFFFFGNGGNLWKCGNHPPLCCREYIAPQVLRPRKRPQKTAWQRKMITIKDHSQETNTNCAMIFLKDVFLPWSDARFLDVTLHMHALRHTLPKTNIAPGNRPQEKEIPIGFTTIFRCELLVSGRVAVSW